ncbi:acyloxyacyl hydrolase [Ramlibacter sp.]|uniref:acyloxyacyl hydrolase n=1 Tax=Ramlibacter sp. TaxID=1917967 RepID=UPI002D6FD0DE|nr:acyloxyacyl hydrolase [Ramlibacter sp.]HYD76175.1 acyloxyacyl hydrolase [Ramlibacter sp.]
MPIAALRAVLASAAFLATLAPSPAWAQELRPAGLYVQGGGGESGLRAGSLGLVWPWRWSRQAGGGELTASTELFASHWRARGFGGGHQGFTQVGVVPMLRYRFAEGRSPWFVEAGIGLSVIDRRFVTPARNQGSRWNFSDNLALGHSFGRAGEHEVSLRWQHTSNAGLKDPNPGVDLVMLRYATRF